MLPNYHIKQIFLTLTVNNQRPSMMGKHILTATNITANPMNNSSVAEYACVDIQCIESNTLNMTENEINRGIYERLQLQPHELHKQQLNQTTTKHTSKTLTNNPSNNATSHKEPNNMNHQHHPQPLQQQHPSVRQQPPSYNLGNYFPRVSSEPTSRKNYQASSRERDLKVGKQF